MKDTITIPMEQYKCLREHLKKANEIFNSLGRFGGLSTPKPEPKKSKSQKINDYKNLIGSGVRIKKPDHLKK